MIGDDIKGEGESLKIVLPVFEGSINDKHFLVIDFVVAFSVGHGFRAKCDGVPEIVVKFLEKDTIYSVARGIDFRLS